MSTPTRRYTTQIGDLERDSSGLLWLIHQHISLTGRGADYRGELLCRAIHAQGGVVEAGIVDLTGDEVTVTGPHLGITHDGLTPVMLDPLGEDETLDLSDFDAYGDGTHLVVVRATPVVEEVAFTSPQRVVRDTSGNVIQTIPAESLTHEMVRTLGVLTLVDGVTPAAGDVSVATVDKSGSSWSNLVPVDDPPVYRWEAGS